MAYHVVDPETIDPREGLPGAHRYLDDAVDLTSVSMQVVTAEPGEDFAPYHSHESGDEVFYVLEGTLHVETPEGVHTAGAGEWFAVQPGNPLRPFNPETADAPVRALLVNAKIDDFRPYDPAGD